MKNIVVIGGTNHDIFAYAHHAVKLNDSNPGYLKDSFGGVGRNIAENLARLALNPTFITVIGKDDIGQKIIEVCNHKIEKKGMYVGLSFYAFFANKNDNPDLLMEADQWWIITY